MVIYETIFILDSLMPPKDIDMAIERITGIITNNKGTIRKVDKWGKKRLAYEIQKKQYGFYVAVEFEGLGNIPKELDSEYNYNDKVLRYLTYRYDKNKIKEMAKEDKEKAESMSQDAPFEQNERINRVMQKPAVEPLSEDIARTEEGTGEEKSAEDTEDIKE